MADILIRGMEMPKEPTPLTLYPDGRWNDYTDGANGEFLPLPEGHGELIERNTVIDEFTKSAKAGQLKPWSIVKTVPTIVPAEGGTDNG